MKRLVTALLAAASCFGPEVAGADELVRFVSCPVYRDTQAGRKSGCWLADDPETGRRYDITTSPTKPDWNFAALVEGIVADSAGNPCGGIVLEPARVSILPEACPRHMLPAEDFPGRPFSRPPRTVAPVSVARPVPEGPFETTTFHIFFEFDRSFIIYQSSDYLLDQAITWIRAAKPEKILVTGYAAVEPEWVSGRRLREDPDTAKARADEIHESLLRLGVAPEIIEVNWRTDPAPVDVEAADGILPASKRRVDIRAEVRPR